LQAVWSIQQQLIRDDAYVIGVYNEDPRDYAKTASVTASTEITPTSNSSAGGVPGGLDGRAANVISGQSRAVVFGPGVAPLQGINGSNRWISMPALPASLSLKLAKPVSLAQAEIVFDTGMHRDLSFNPVKRNKAPWAPQVETVRDYTIRGRTTVGGPWIALCNITDNYQRRRIHPLPCPVSPPNPGPPPPPPPAVAVGALVSDLCVASAAQLWTMRADGTVATPSPSPAPPVQQPAGTVKGELISGGTTAQEAPPPMLCLGFDDSVLAFGGTGKAVVARPCTDRSPKWVLRDADAATDVDARATREGTGMHIGTHTAAGTGGKYLALAKAEPCPAGGNGPVCDANRATSITFAGAGTDAVNGVYKPTNASLDGFPVFQKLNDGPDVVHSLHRFGGTWKLTDGGSTVFYAATSAANLDGPPAGGSAWSATAGSWPVPQNVTCEGGGGGPACSCVHSVECAACHTTGTGGQVYIPPTQVELAACNDEVTHIRWLQLAVVGGGGGSERVEGTPSPVMLMSDGLCLGAPSTVTGGSGDSGSDVNSALRGAHNYRRATRPISPRLSEGVGGEQRQHQSHPDAPLPPLVEVEVTVTATHGIANAIINEVRLYGAEGVHPFPAKPSP
jgi:hypothetical protein